MFFLTVISSAVSLYIMGFQRMSIPQTFFAPRSISFLRLYSPLTFKMPESRAEGLCRSISLYFLSPSLALSHSYTHTNKHQAQICTAQKTSEVAYDVPFKWENRPNHHSGSHHKQYTYLHSHNCIVYCNVKECQHIL